MLLEKDCKDCIKIKPLNDFPVNRKAADGHAHICKICNSLRVTEWRIKNPKKFLESRKLYTEQNKEALTKYKKQYREDNKARQKKWMRNWIESNRGRKRFLQARRRTALLNATPKWADQNEIARIYDNCPSGYHVDHIMPLRGKNFSGLHVPWNLQYLPALVNLSKGNRIK